MTVLAGQEDKEDKKETKEKKEKTENKDGEGAETLDRRPLGRRGRTAHRTPDRSGETSLKYRHCVAIAT